ncbi:MAG: S41 family peptidase [Candidatus Aminicenantes bacterium]|nr:S41 family peptidase [Candidatus Aminicenantes bacterium]
MIKTNRILFLVGVLLFAFFLLLADRIIFQSHPELGKEYRYLSLFSEVAAQVKTNYVEDVDPSEKFPGAFSAMLGSLDPFSSYLDADKTQTYGAYRSGRCWGCGIYGAKVLNYFYITDVTPGSPAEQAGLKHGDMIKAVNGVSLYSRSYWEMFLSLLSTGPQNIQVTLFKKDSRDTRKFELQTRLIALHTVVTPMPKDILLVKLPRFDAAAAALLKEQLAAYSGAPDRTDKPLKLIIDLRTYRGGDLESFKQIANLFFNDKIALTLKLKDRVKDIFPETKGKNIPAYKAVVIINRSTRMYGELLAAIFKDTGAKTGNGTASRYPVTLVGTTTQGFISELKAISLQDGSSILLTEGLFLLNGKATASKGIEPDIEIKDKNSEQIMDKCISIFASGAAPGGPTTEKQDNGKEKGKTL